MLRYGGTTKTCVHGSKDTEPAATSALPGLNFVPDDPLDHCETPRVAFEHIAPLLAALAKVECSRGESSQLRLYDPYFCTGSSR
jgi:hypothetical protein